jgi:hypothetical protein
MEAYQSLIGSFGWLAMATRPDLAPVHSFLLSFNSKPSLVHMSATLHVLHYIHSTHDYGIHFLVGKSARKSVEFRNYSNYGPFELRNFHQNFIFLIVKCVPANLEHVPASSESSPIIDSSNFMNRKTFPLSLPVVSGIKF